MSDNNDGCQQRFSEKDCEAEPVIQQTMLILCEQQAVQKLVETLIKKLLHFDITAEVVLWGVNQKRREGFIVLELSTFLSLDFLTWLKDERVKQYLLYPGQPPKPSMVPPALPAGYQLLAPAVPLLGVNDEWWICRAAQISEGGGRGEEGILLYEDQRALKFLTGEESLTALDYLIAQAFSLFSSGSQALFKRHARLLERLRVLWLTEEKREARKKASTTEVHLDEEAGHA